MDLQNRVEERITTLSILKKRWPEVAVIVAVGLLRWLGSMGASLTQNSISKSGFNLIMLAVAVLLLILRAGFLRTAYLHGGNRQQVITLLQEGKRFFWQLFIFACLFGIILMIPTLIIVGIVSPSESWILGLCIIALKVILMKPLLLVPAMIIVRKMQVFDALRSFMTYKIFEARELLILFAAQLVFQLLYPFFARPLLENSVIIYHSTRAITNIVGTLLTIAVALSAVLFVAERPNLAIVDTEENNGDEFTE